MPVGQRSSLTNDSVNAPGPGAYNTAQSNHGQNGCTMKGRYATGGPMDNNNQNPGPGQYNTSVRRDSHGKNGTFGDSMRSNLGGKD